jgi:hypothetical protein
MERGREERWEGEKKKRWEVKKEGRGGGKLVPKVIFGAEFKNLVQF